MARRSTLPRIALLAAMTPTLAGCGVIFGGTTETIRIDSAPQGARLVAEPTVGTSTTPTSLELGYPRHDALPHSGGAVLLTPQTAPGSGSAGTQEYVAVGSGST